MRNATATLKIPSPLLSKISTCPLWEECTYLNLINPLQQVKLKMRTSEFMHML
jgi:hypothetical protein